MKWFTQNQGPDQPWYLVSEDLKYQLGPLPKEDAIKIGDMFGKYEEYNHSRYECVISGDTYEERCNSAENRLSSILWLLYNAVHSNTCECEICTLNRKMITIIKPERR